VGDLLFIGSCAGSFYAINKSSGNLQWSYDIRKDGKQVSFHGDPLVVGDLILIGTDHNCVADGIGHVYAFERATGKVRWKYRSTSVPTNIVQLNSNVYFGSFQDKWTSIDLHTGRLNWSFETGVPNPDCNWVRDPVLDENRLLVVGLDGIIYSLDAGSGRVIWKRKLGAAPSTDLALQDRAVYVGTNDQRVYRLSAETGAVISELAVEAKPEGGLVFSGDSLLMFAVAAERTGHILSVDSKLAGVRWKRQSSPDWASERPHLWKGLVVAGNCRGELAAFRASDGEPQWNLSVKGCIRSIGSSGNMLFAGVQEGTVYAFEGTSR
jgi:outer membrane protein assembly factor BamB